MGKRKDPLEVLRKEHPELDTLLEFIVNYVGSDFEAFLSFIFELVDYRTDSWDDFDRVIDTLQSYRESV